MGGGSHALGGLAGGLGGSGVAELLREKDLEIKKMQEALEAGAPKEFFFEERKKDRCRALC